MSSMRGGASATGKEQGPWQGRTDGTQWMHQTLIVLFRYVNLRFVYLFMAVFVVPFYMLFFHQGYISIYHYFRHRLHYGPVKAFCKVYQNHYRFGQIILDRFAVYAGQQFHTDVEGGEHFDRLQASEQGIIVLSSHVGNYELAGYAFRSRQKRFNALVYAGEAAVVMENRNRMLSRNNMRMIPVGNDLSHIFLANEALANGEIVSIPADRIFGSPRFIECQFFGTKARFPLGPFAMALQRGVPVVAMMVMKEDTHRYKIYVREVKADEGLNTRREQAASLAQHFARELELVLRKYPEQWFNYYDFWQQDGE